LSAFESPGSCSKFHNEELHGFDYTQSIIRVIESRRIKWAGNVAHVRKKETFTGFCLQNLKKGDHFENRHGWEGWANNINMDLTERG
jgi:hypothetical protein